MIGTITLVLLVGFVAAIAPVMAARSFGLIPERRKIGASEGAALGSSVKTLGGDCGGDGGGGGCD